MKHYQAAVHDISQGVKRFFDQTFAAISVNGPELDPDRLRNAKVMVACTHRSQADYFLVGYVLFGLGFDRMRFAAGENLTTLPIIGRWFRDMGAFSVRRGKTFGREYVKNLCEQVVDMLATGDQIIVFPEGGRSYNGNMMELRAGILGSSVMSQMRDTEQEVLVLPMSISYERLPELSYFDLLMRGKGRREKKGVHNRLLGTVQYFGADAIAFSKFILARRFGVDYGEVYVDYGEPLPVSTIVDLEEDIVQGARDDFSACRPAAQKVGLRMYEEFHALYRLLPAHVLACVLRDRKDIDIADAAPRCNEVIHLLANRRRNVGTLRDLREDEVVRRGVAQLSRQKAVKRRSNRVVVKKPEIVRYYASATD